MRASPHRVARPMRHPSTPSSDFPAYDRNLVQPSPNRTEAAAAMMHLFSSSSQPTPEGAGSSMHTPTTRPPIPTPKAKRKYVRKAARRPSSAVKSLSKIAESADEDDQEMSPSHICDDDAESLHDQGDDSKFFPFREYNRKEKSLGLLCENFLKLYRSDQVAEICLDRAALQLGVERRRIYDIVNILESIHLVSRKSKNLYNWHGLSALPVSITAMKKKYTEQQAPSESPSSRNEYSIKDRRRGKSLSKLSQMFVQLFLKKEHCIIPLDMAAKQLIQLEDSDHEEDRQLKTKIRRLYDVANVLVSVGLIEKLQLSNSRKPVFRWRNRTENAEHTAPTQTMKQESEQMDIASYNDAMEMDTRRTSGSSISDDNSDDGSDSLSDVGGKRKPIAQLSPGWVPPDNDLVAKRVRTCPAPSPPPSGIEIASPIPKKLLRFDRNQAPIHPQTILQEQQLLVRRYMQQYIREYIEHVLRQQASPSGIDIAASAAEATPSDSNMQARMAAAKRSIAREMDDTPVHLPTLINRVANELAGSLNESTLWGNSTSPQSVADLFEFELRSEKQQRVPLCADKDPTPTAAAGAADANATAAAAATPAHPPIVRPSASMETPPLPLPSPPASSSSSTLSREV